MKKVINIEAFNVEDYRDAIDSLLTIANGHERFYRIVEDEGQYEYVIVAWSNARFTMKDAIAAYKEVCA